MASSGNLCKPTACFSLLNHRQDAALLQKAESPDRRGSRLSLPGELYAYPPARPGQPPPRDCGFGFDGAQCNTETGRMASVA